MRAETSRQWFCEQLQVVGGGTTAILAADAGKRPVVTYVSVNVFVVAAAQTVTFEGSVSGIMAFKSATDNLGASSLGPLFSGLSLDLGDGINVSVSGGAGAIFVVVEGYYEFGS